MYLYAFIFIATHLEQKVLSGQNQKLVGTRPAQILELVSLSLVQNFVYDARISIVQGCDRICLILELVSELGQNLARHLVLDSRQSSAQVIRLHILTVALLESVHAELLSVGHHNVAPIDGREVDVLGLQERRVKTNGCNARAILPVPISVRLKCILMIKFVFLFRPKKGAMLRQKLEN